MQLVITMNLWEAKLVAIVGLGGATLLVGLLPACFARHGRQNWPMLLSALLCFGGGVLLSTSLVHILPELREKLDQKSAPYAELIFCTGFFILYALDELVHLFYGAGSHEHAILSAGTNGTNVGSTSSALKTNYGTVPTERHALLYGVQLPYNPAYQPEVPTQLCHVEHQEPCRRPPTVRVGLIIALSVHALLEGLVVGLEPTPAKVLLLLGAVSSHKLVMAFCLGVEISSSGHHSSLRHFLSIFVFTFGSIAGIVIGMVVMTLPEGQDQFVVPILQGLAGGTLLYVTVTEVLPRERARWHENPRKYAGLVQFSSVIVGFALLTVLSWYLDVD